MTRPRYIRYAQVEHGLAVVEPRFPASAGPPAARLQRTRAWTSKRLASRQAHRSRHGIPRLPPLHPRRLFEERRLADLSADGTFRREAVCRRGRPANLYFPG